MLHERVLVGEVRAREVRRGAAVAVDGLQRGARRVRLESREVERKRVPGTCERVAVQGRAHAVRARERRDPPAERQVVERCGERRLRPPHVARQVVDRVRRARGESVHVVEEQPVLQHDRESPGRVRVPHPAALEDERNIAHRALHRAALPPSRRRNGACAPHNAATSRRSAARSGAGPMRRRYRRSTWPRSAISRASLSTKNDTRRYSSSSWALSS